MKREHPKLHDLVWMWLNDNVPKHLNVWPKSDGTQESTLFFIECPKEHGLVMIVVNDGPFIKGLYVRANFWLWKMAQPFNEFSEDHFKSILAVIAAEDKNGCCECGRDESSTTVTAKHKTVG